MRKMRGGLAAAASLALAAAGVGAVAVVSSDAAGTISTTVTLAPTDDTYISQAAKTTNFGSATSMTTNGARNKVKRVYLRFAVNGLPSDATVTGARIVLTALNSSGIRPTYRYRCSSIGRTACGQRSGGSMIIRPTSIPSHCSISRRIRAGAFLE